MDLFVVTPYNEVIHYPCNIVCIHNFTLFIQCNSLSRQKLRAMTLHSLVMLLRQWIPLW